MSGILLGLARAHLRRQIPSQQEEQEVVEKEEAMRIIKDTQEDVEWGVLEQEWILSRPTTTRGGGHWIVYAGGLRDRVRDAGDLVQDVVPLHLDPAQIGLWVVLSCRASWQLHGASWNKEQFTESLVRMIESSILYSRDVLSAAHHSAVLAPLLLKEPNTASLVFHLCASSLSHLLEQIGSSVQQLDPLIIDTHTMQGFNNAYLLAELLVSFISSSSSVYLAEVEHATMFSTVPRWRAAWHKLLTIAAQTQDEQLHTIAAPLIDLLLLDQLLQSKLN